MKKFANRGTFFIGHDGEIKIDTIDSVESNDCVRNAILDFIAQRTSGDGQRDLHRYHWSVDRNTADHPEIDDAPVEFGVLNGTKDLDDIGIGDGHFGGSRFGSGNFSYGNR